MTFVHFFTSAPFAHTCSYVFEDERGVCPQVEYCFDLELPCDFVPVGADGEVDSFQLVSIAEVRPSGHHMIYAFFFGRRYKGLLL